MMRMIIKGGIIANEDAFSESQQKETPTLKGENTQHFFFYFTKTAIGMQAKRGESVRRA